MIEQTAGLAEGRAALSGLRVLAVEDNLGDAVLVRDMLEHAVPGEVAMVHADRLETGVEQLLVGGFDCILLDLSLPDADGLDALAHIRTAALDVPIIVLSGRSDEVMAMRAVHDGAQDYLVKGEVDARLLARSIAYAIERKRAEVQLAHQALHDQLTGLPNRALLLDRLGQALARLTRSSSAAAVLFLDLDRFKVVNDSLGHDAGDHLLVGVARRLDDVLRAGDTAARFGGDEFVILCEDVAGEQHAIAIAERIAGALAAPFVLGGEEVFVHTSVGIAVATSSTARPEALLRDADAAMYRAKERGGGTLEVFDDAMRERAVRRLEIENALHRAIERSELRVLYQPQVRLRSGELSGVEALARWEHPERGLIGPGDFIPAAEETGLIHDLGAWVLEEACRQSAAWACDRRAGEPPVTMSVNLSARQCLHPDLVGTVAGIVDRTGADPATLCLEVTESAVMDDLEAMAAVLGRLKGLGLTLAIDDFGTGYSSLRALQRLPFDVLKIDRSFVAEMHRSSQQEAIAQAVISLSRALGLRTVAEGIESSEQLQRLRALGCDIGQGFHFARPRTADTVGFGLSSRD